MKLQMNFIHFHSKFNKQRFYVIICNDLTLSLIIFMNTTMNHFHYGDKHDILMVISALFNSKNFGDS